MAAAVGMTADYDSHSDFQLEANCRHAAVFLEALKHVDRTGEVLTVADYGAATGLNSMKLFTPAFRAFRETSGTPIMVYHTDLPGNHWPVLYNNALTSPHSYLSLPDIHMAGVGRSFYGRLFPANSISLMHIANAIHWFSKWSSTDYQLQKFLENDLKFHAELRSLSDADLNRFISARCEELKTGGRLIVAAYSSPLRHDFHYHALRRMQEEGLTSSKLLQQAPVYYYHTSTASLEAAVALHPALSLVHMHEYDLLHVLYRQYKTDRNIRRYAKSLAEMVRAFLGDLMKQLFIQEKSEVDLNEVFFNYVEDYFRANPKPFAMKVLDAVIDKVG